MSFELGGRVMVLQGDAKGQYGTLGTRWRGFDEDEGIPRSMARLSDGDHPRRADLVQSVTAAGAFGMSRPDSARTPWGVTDAMGAS